MSDLHGILPQELPECDAVLLAGDICPHNNVYSQLEWLDGNFRRWLHKIKKPVFACAGNHDWPFFEHPERCHRLHLPWEYLQDESASFKGLKIYGTPWQRRFYDWAFNLEEHQLAGKWNLIPDDTDVLICHSPPKYYGDMNSQGVSCGSEALTWRIMQIKPKLVVFGHIHPGRGEWRNSDTIFANVAMVDDHYQPVHKPWVVELEGV